jgi:hypothetical protein
MYVMTRVTAYIVFLFVLLTTSAALAVDGTPDAPPTPQDFISVVRNAIRMEGAGDNIDQEIHHNDELAQELIQLLSRDFRTNAFSKRSEITLVHFDYTIDEVKHHFAVAVITFPDPKSADKAFQTAKAVGREHFIKKILTPFRVFQKDKHFIIVFSETAGSPHTRNIIDRLTDDFAKTGQQ